MCFSRLHTLSVSQTLNIHLPTNSAMVLVYKNNLTFSSKMFAFNANVRIFVHKLKHVEL